LTEEHHKAFGIGTGICSQHDGKPSAYMITNDELREHGFV
jgi:hypothetical protein